MSDQPEWFAAKSHGVGAGLPIAWQGWVLTLTYVGIVIAAGFLLAEHNPWAFGSVTFTATAIFLLIAAKTTRGGWRWRWGKTEDDS
jgi:hypothetical protein